MVLTEYNTTIKNCTIYLYSCTLLYSNGAIYISSAYDRAAIKFRGAEADINFSLEDYGDDLKQVMSERVNLFSFNMFNYNLIFFYKVNQTLSYCCLDFYSWSFYGHTW